MSNLGSGQVAFQTRNTLGKDPSLVEHSSETVQHYFILYFYVFNGVHCHWEIVGLLDKHVLVTVCCVVFVYFVMFLSQSVALLLWSSLFKEDNQFLKIAQCFLTQNSKTLNRKVRNLQQTQQSLLSKRPSKCEGRLQGLGCRLCGGKIHHDPKSKEIQGWSRSRFKVFKMFDQRWFMIRTF